MKLILPLETIQEQDSQSVGGKAYALSRLLRGGLSVPPGLCVTTAAYHCYVKATGLGERIEMELHRRNLDEMRWEELWDASLRLRNLFLRTPVPREVADVLTPELEQRFGHRAVVVRSSAPGEDSAHSSFAGVHASYVNVSGLSALMDHIKLVWASLWSDAALLYRRELHLDVAGSAMAVLVQELIQGQRSGVAFSQDPTGASRVVVESVWGLNQGLVDGSVAPDRWYVDRGSSRSMVHQGTERRQQAAPTEQGVEVIPLPFRQQGQPPLQEAEVMQVTELSLKLERLFGQPQDVEWTFCDSRLLVLQSRPITTPARETKKDKRAWYLSLHRSLPDLRRLRRRVEGEFLPQLDRQADTMAREDLTCLSVRQLAARIRQWSDVAERWQEVYYAEFIPLAHAIRLFGEVYNDIMRPDDPFEFVRLLRGTEMKALQRNQSMESIRNHLRERPRLREALMRGTEDCPDEPLRQMALALVDEFGLGFVGSGGRERACGQLLRFLAGQTERNVDSAIHQSPETLGLKDFLGHVPVSRRAFLEELVELARASYRLRDDDNILIGRLQDQLARAVSEGRTRLKQAGRVPAAGASAARIAALLEGNDYEDAPEHEVETERTAAPGVQARQIRGQPAGQGLNTGPARVIHTRQDLLQFQQGEVLVCDALDPTMTFVVPLAVGIVERRGGMLVHGAIVAREYGLPCVTGVSEATSMIATGDEVTVDGYIGVVIIARRSRNRDAGAGI